MGWNNTIIGRQGEDIALDFLEKKGLIFRDKNWRYGHLEIDLIFEDDSSIRIVEVKTLLERDGFNPIENISSTKINRLITAAQHYIAEKHIEKEVKFDVVAILINESNQFEINYIPEAFWPIKNSRLYT